MIPKCDRCGNDLIYSTEEAAYFLKWYVYNCQTCGAIRKYSFNPEDMA